MRELSDKELLSIFKAISLDVSFIENKEEFRMYYSSMFSAYKWAKNVK